MPIAAIWAVASKLPWKYIGIAIATLTLALLIWRAPWAEHRQKAKDAVALSAEHARAEGFKANQITLTAALTRQNAAVAALKAEGDKRVADGKTALKQAEKANQALSDQAAALRRSATRTISKDEPCVISNTLGDMGSI